MNWHRYRMRRWVGVLACVWATWASPALTGAQEAKPQASTPESDPYNPRLWNADVMMETAVQQISRRYNLNPEQEKATRALLRAKVTEFLKAHESELRSLLAEAIELQLNPSAVDAGRMQEWSKKAVPLFEAARKAILDGNEKWGVILDEEQRKIHRMDLEQMQTTFGFMEERFGRWAKGGFTPQDLQPVPPTRVGQPVTTRGGVTPRAPTSNPEDFWENWVRQTAKLYKFTKEQETAAMGILKECRERASKFRVTNKSKIEEAQAREVGLRGKPDKITEYRKAQEELRKLLQPINVEIFTELQNRVVALSTEDQRAAVSAAREKQMDRLRQQRNESRTALQNAAAGSRPAASQPASAAVIERN